MHRAQQSSSCPQRHSAISFLGVNRVVLSSRAKLITGKVRVFALIIRTLGNISRRGLCLPSEKTLIRGMSYQLYRNTTLGITLQDALDELISSQQITPDLALKVNTESPQIAHNQ